MPKASLTHQRLGFAIIALPPNPDFPPAFEANPSRGRRGIEEAACRVPGTAWLLNGDGRYCNTDAGQSPDPA